MIEPRLLRQKNDLRLLAIEMRKHPQLGIVVCQVERRKLDRLFLGCPGSDLAG